MRILIVDDDDVLRVAATRWLAEHWLQFAGDEAEALVKIRLYEFDLILCDVNIPPGDPGEVATKLSDRVGLVPVLRISTGWDGAIPKEKDDIREAVKVIQDCYDLELQTCVASTTACVRKAREQLQARAEHGNE